MRRLSRALLICCLGLALASPARAQQTAQAVASTSARPGSVPEPTASAAAPSPSSPDPQAQPQAPTQTAPAQPAAATAPTETEHGLFEQTWHQLQIGGRFTSVNGDQARYQRYQDLRDGLLFTDFRYAYDDAAGASQFRATADNVGWRDQRFIAHYDRVGRFVVSGLWDEIPQFYSVDTKTPYTTTKSPLLLPDSTQQAIQSGDPAKLNLYIPIAPQFDLRERRDIGNVNFRATPTSNVDVTAAFTTTRHRGQLPWGGSFGFNNDVEVALPYDSRTNDLSIGTEWTNTRQMLRVSYDGSWFNNLDPTLVWDSPLTLTDTTSVPGRGQMALWPTNSAQTVSAGGYARFAHRTQFTGFLSFGTHKNDEPLLPFTINSALTQIALPRPTAQADAHIFSTNLGLVSHPSADWDFTARARIYDYSNNMPVTPITQYVSYDTSIGTSTTGGPELFAHNRTTIDGDATWSGLRPVALSAGYTLNHTGYDFRIFSSANENVLRLSADAVSAQSMSFHAKYEYGSRTGSDLNEDLLVEIGEQPAMRHYDLANRTRNQFTGIVDFVPNDRVTFSVSGGTGKDKYPDSYFGLQDASFNTFSFGVDYQEPDGLGIGGNYNFERYTGLQRSRSASSDQMTDPTRDWTADTKETVNYFSIYVTPPKFGEKTEARLSYDFSYAEGSYLYTIVPGGPLAPPSQLPNVYNKLQQLHVDVRHRLSPKLALAFSYLYEPFRVFDFAFDPSVVNSIVQPSSLVMGYVYRPYTANSGVISLRYYW